MTEWSIKPLIHGKLYKLRKKTKTKNPALIIIIIIINYYRAKGVNVCSNWKILTAVKVRENLSHSFSLVRLYQPAVQIESRS